MNNGEAILSIVDLFKQLYKVLMAEYNAAVEEGRETSENRMHQALTLHTIISARYGLKVMYEEVTRDHEKESGS